MPLFTPAPELFTDLLNPDINIVLPISYSAVIMRSYLIASGNIVTISNNARLRIL